MKFFGNITKKKITFLTFVKLSCTKKNVIKLITNKSNFF